MNVPWLAKSDYSFPPLSSALEEPNGLLAIGGDLSCERLLIAYQNGVFPWYEEGQPILWWSPDPRCVLFPSNLHLSRSLRKTLRSRRFQVSADRAFDRVIRACAAPRAHSDGTWITPAMIAAYNELHARGIAHSIEVWDGDVLCGGSYGLALGRVFFGESMFSLRPDASKVALVALCHHLNRHDFAIIDCQVDNPHLRSLGAQMISRSQFAHYLTRFVNDGGQIGAWSISLGTEDLLNQ